MLNNINELGFGKAKEILWSEALKRLTKDEIIDFEGKYSSIVNEYRTNKKLVFSSNSFDIEKLPSLQDWSKELLKPESSQT